MYTIKWSVMQYVIVRPGMLAASVSLMLNRSHVPMADQPYPSPGSLPKPSASFVHSHTLRSLHKFISPLSTLSASGMSRNITLARLSCLSDAVRCVSVALYGLIVFYSLTHSELEGRRPFAKFICIKGMCLSAYRYLLAHHLSIYSGIVSECSAMLTTVAPLLTCSAQC